MRRLHLGLLCVLTVAAQTACEKRVTYAPDGSVESEGWHFVGEPNPANKWKPPTAVTDFDTLFKQNCVACHGIGSSASAAVAMDNEAYLAVLSEDTLRNVITNGVEGRLMPAFALRNGGLLSDDQITTLVNGILANRKPISGPLPSYSAPPGNAANGETLFNASFAKGLPAAKTFLDSAFLGTVSDQYVRTLVIAGLPDIGYPDFRNFIPGRPLTDQEVSDVTAWILSHRTNEYGQPMSAPSQQQGQPISAPSQGLPAEPASPDSSAAEQVP